MKIRTRLLLFLLPTLIGSIALISSLLAFNWYREISEGFETRLKSAVVAAAALIDPDKFESVQNLQVIRDELAITDLYVVPIRSAPLPTIPTHVYLTKPYKTEDGSKRMTGYAPIFNQQGHVMGLMAADVNADLIDQKFQESLFLILLGAGFTFAIVVATLYFIANKISHPVQKLNNSALAIAAGQYGESIQVNGPKEIVELANTLNTMSECLHENINRLKENSLLRERMYGEYECSTLLQHLMLQKNIDDCRSDAVAVKSITFFSEYPRGLLLDFPKPDRKENFLIHMAEAEEAGFEGMYQLLTQYKISRDNPKHLSLLYNRPESLLICKGPQQPLFWSLDNRRFIHPLEGAIKLESGDFFFLFNSGLINFYKEPKAVADLLAKVLRLFASDGLETTAAMLQKELTFATKRKELSEDIHLLCFQVLN
ncbi:MAG: HAMP domain-containing protein [Verrucomicrobia bacterium]|nr:HAMP domain-containing protein [Verrucomicrobiota bacterium]